MSFVRQTVMKRLAPVVEKDLVQRGLTLWARKAGGSSKPAEQIVKKVAARTIYDVPHVPGRFGLGLAVNRAGRPRFTPAFS